MNMRELLFTFDHELFLGRNSGTPQNCLLRPASAVVDILERHGLRGVFFVDTTYLMRLEDVATRFALVADDLGHIIMQLKDLLRRGHAIYPHIHPHWLFHFRVPALDAAVDRVRAGGGLVAATFELPDGRRIAVCDDPQGAAFALEERA